MPRVGFEMLFEVGFCCVGLAAVFAREFVTPLMDFHMLVQVSFLCEGCLAA